MGFDATVGVNHDGTVVFNEDEPARFGEKRLTSSCISDGAICLYESHVPYIVFFPLRSSMLLSLRNIVFLALPLVSCSAIISALGFEVVDFSQ